MSSSPPFEVKALYAYDSEHPDDLPFGEGQRIVVDTIEDDDWYTGHLAEGGKTGMFPRNFVKVVEHKHARRPPPIPAAAKEEDPAEPEVESEDHPEVQPKSVEATKTGEPELSAGAAGAAAAKGIDQDPATHASEPEAQPDSSDLSARNEPKAPAPEPAAEPAREPEPVQSAPKPQPAPQPAPHPAAAPEKSIEDKTASLSLDPRPAQSPPEGSEPRSSPGESRGPKRSAFMDRIAAFNVQDAPRVPMFQQPKPRSFVNKPYVAPPPTGNYAPPMPKPNPQPIGKHPPPPPPAKPDHLPTSPTASSSAAPPAAPVPTSPESPRDDHSHNQEPQEDAVPKMSLKERIKMLQQQQEEERARAEAALEKKKARKAAKREAADGDNEDHDDSTAAAAPVEDPTSDQPVPTDPLSKQHSGRALSEHFTGSDQGSVPAVPPVPQVSTVPVVPSAGPEERKLSIDSQRSEYSATSDRHSHSRSSSVELPRDKEVREPHIPAGAPIQERQEPQEPQHEPERISATAPTVPPPTRSVPAPASEEESDEEDSDEEEDDDDDDEEEAKRIALRERMAKISGGMGMHLGMILPGAAPPAKKKKAKEPKEPKEPADAREVEQEPQLMPVPVMPFADPNALKALRRPAEDEDDESEETEPEGAVAREAPEPVVVEAPAAATPAAPVPTRAPELPTRAPEPPSRAPEAPTRAPKVPTSAPEVPTRADLPRSARPVPEALQGPPPPPRHHPREVARALDDSRESIDSSASQEYRTLDPRFTDTNPVDEVIEGKSPKAMTTTTSTNTDELGDDERTEESDDTNRHSISSVPPALADKRNSYISGSGSIPPIPPHLPPVNTATSSPAQDIKRASTFDGSPSSPNPPGVIRRSTFDPTSPIRAPPPPPPHVPVPVEIDEESTGGYDADEDTDMATAASHDEAPDTPTVRPAIPAPFSPPPAPPPRRGDESTALDESDTTEDEYSSTAAPRAPRDQPVVPAAPVAAPRAAPPAIPPAGAGAAPGRASLDRTVSRRSSDFRSSLDAGYVAGDLELEDESAWWTAPKAVPPSIQARAGRDLIYEVEDNEMQKRGGRAFVIRDIYILYHDYSQTGISVKMDKGDPVNSVTFEQTHTAPPNLRQDQLEEVYHKFGPQVLRLAQTPPPGDGEFVPRLIAAIPGALPSIGQKAHGALVYGNLANATVRQYDEIRPGDIITFKNARFQGHKGSLHQKYSAEAGKAGAHSAVVVEWDGTKKKVKVVEESGRRIKQESYRLGDLKSGEVRAFRVVGRDYVGWDQ